MRNIVKAWSREDLVRAILAMVKIAGWSLALISAAYIFRFTSVFKPVNTFFFGHETAQQISSAKAEWGQFGDFVGGALNPLVSLLALVGLAFTILLQHESMTRVQKDALESKRALSAQTRLSLDAARLQALAAALDVISEMHRQAVATSSMAAIELLERKEILAGQIIEINEQLRMQASATEEDADAA